MPATARTSGGYELFGYVRYVPAEEGGEPSDFSAHADYTDETAERNPEWQLDLCDEVDRPLARRGRRGGRDDAVWGRPLVSGGAIVTAELAGLAVDQCELLESASR